MDVLLPVYHWLSRQYTKRVIELHRRNILKQANGGKGLYIEGRIMVIHGNHLTLGKNIYIGADAYINCLGGIEIGDHTIISRRATIYSYDHNFMNPKRLPFDEAVIKRPVSIGRYVWIGMNASIAPGSKIGDGAIVGLGCVVSGDIPENAIVVSPKARIVGYRDNIHAAMLDSRKRYFTDYQFGI